MKRVLVAAFGNELRGDDGFGIAVLRRLESRRSNGNSDVRFLEVGTGGLRLAQELLSPCDRLIIVDAMTRGERPGTVYVTRVERVPPAHDIDMHLAVPANALAVAQALGALPPETFLVGCEPVETEELTMELSPPVQAAVERAACEIEALMQAEA